MKLLIVTQKVDKNDDILGFFHQWILEFAKYYEFITVIALQVGEYDLPENVKVLSLGKEKGGSKISYIFNFYKYIWNERKNYDTVFVHMNTEYIILGGVWWKIVGKKVFLWYNHTYGTISARISGFITNITFHTSPFAFTAKFKNATKMPAGIDINIFKRYEDVKKVSNSVLYIGRISPVKHVDVLLKAVRILDSKGIKLVLDIYGSAPERDKKYYERLQEDFKDIKDKGIVNFRGSIPNYKSAEVFNAHEISINLTPEGNFDKTVLESMACETLTLVSSPAFESILTPKFLFEECNSDSLANKIENIFNISSDQKYTYGVDMRRKIIDEHNLTKLAKKIAILSN